MKQQVQFSVPVRILAAGDDPVSKSPRPAPETTLKAIAEPPLPLRHALPVQAARYWLELGEADQALRELETLPSQAWQHPQAVEVRIAALRIGGERV